MGQDAQADHATPKWVERELTHSRNVIANAKVVVTFSAALAATFASAALDSNKQLWLGRVGGGTDVSHALSDGGRRIATR